MRFKNRYLLYELIFEDEKVDTSIAGGLVYKLIKDNCLLNHGEYGFGIVSQSFQVKYYNQLTNLCIVRAPRDNYRIIQSSVTYISNIKQRSLTFKLIHLGGTIRSCQIAALKFNKIQLNNLFIKQKLINTQTNQPINEKSENEMKQTIHKIEAEINSLET